MKFIKLAIVTATIFLTNIESYSQAFHENMLLTVEVKCIDSQYLMIPHLKILDDTKIRIHENLIYGNEGESLADCKFILERLEGSYYENIYISSLREFFYDYDRFDFKNFSRVDFLSDTINLQDYIPLRIGEYKLYIAFDYYLNGEKNTLISDAVYFKVLFKPPANRSMFK
jgi:hypothetical protein